METGAVPAGQPGAGFGLKQRRTGHRSYRANPGGRRSGGPPRSCSAEHEFGQAELGGAPEAPEDYEGLGASRAWISAFNFFN
jgi:hypothetical protein